MCRKPAISEEESVIADQARSVIGSVAWTHAVMIGVVYPHEQVFKPNKQIMTFARTVLFVLTGRSGEASEGHW